MLKLIKRTIKIPVHYQITRHKLEILNKLTTKLTYAVNLLNDAIKEYYEQEFELPEQTQLDQDVRYDLERITGLNCSYIQQVEAIVLMTWKSYEKLYDKWENQEPDGVDDKKWEKWKKRQPSFPNFKGKIPVWIDFRTGKIEKSKTSKKFKYFIKLHTLNFAEFIYIPLNCADYHIKMLEKGKPKSFQLIKRHKKWYCYMAVEYEVEVKPPIMVKGVDLGMNRCIATVLLKPNSSLTHNDFNILKDSKKSALLNKYDEIIAELQRQQKWRKLRELKSKRLNVAKTLDREIAKQLAESSKDCLVVVGYPKGIRLQSYKGDGNKKFRKRLHKWTFGRIISYIKQECEERGIPVKIVKEWWTSKTCHKCGSRNTFRPTQSEIQCLNCGMKYNADFNASVNIGYKGLKAIPSNPKMLKPSTESLDEPLKLEAKR